MAKLLIIADDFTGALDTGIQFVNHGAATTVVTDSTHDFLSAEKSADVLVIAVETRRLQPKEAYKIVYNITRKALQAGVPYIYKKTDSALRGNIGSELTAVMNAANIDALPFFPAFPKLNRITKMGVHYIDNVPVAQSVFGQDPFEPVLNSAVTEILRRQTAIPAVIHPMKKSYKIADSGIQIFDAQTDADLKRIGQNLGLEQLQFSAGCAGFAAVLSDLLNFEGSTPKLPKLEDTLFTFCGSVNPITIRQMEEARKQGFPHVHLNPVQKLEQRWIDSDFARKCIQKWLAQTVAEKRFILDVNDPPGHQDTHRYAQEQGLALEQLRVQISSNLAALIKRMLDDGLNATLLCSGGDTLLALMRAVDVSELIPLYEIEPGVVLTEFVYRKKNYHIISKSGGFGNREFLSKLPDKIFQKSTTY